MLEIKGNEEFAEWWVFDSTNYSFTYKRTESIGLRLVHVYAVKPRQKRAGLFKGEIYLDATAGSLRQAKGKMMKSPSFFIQKIEFAQEYADFKGFTVPVHLHSLAKARVLGRVVVDIVVYDYSLLAQNTALLILHHSDLHHLGERRFTCGLAF